MISQVQPPTRAKLISTGPTLDFYYAYNFYEVILDLLVLVHPSPWWWVSVYSHRHVVGQPHTAVVPRGEVQDPFVGIYTLCVHIRVMVNMWGGECTLWDVKNVGVKALETFCIHDTWYYRCNISQGKHSYQYVTNMCQFVSIQSMDRVYTYMRN